MSARVEVDTYSYPLAGCVQFHAIILPKTTTGAISTTMAEFGHMDVYNIDVYVGKNTNNTTVMFYLADATKRKIVTLTNEPEPDDGWDVLHFEGDLDLALRCPSGEVKKMKFWRR